MRVRLVMCVRSPQLGSGKTVNILGREARDRTFLLTGSLPQVLTMAGLKLAARNSTCISHASDRDQTPRAITSQGPH